MPSSCGGGAPHHHIAVFSILERGTPPQKKTARKKHLAGPAATFLPRLITSLLLPEEKQEQTARRREKAVHIFTAPISLGGILPVWSYSGFPWISRPTVSSLAQGEEGKEERSKVKAKGGGKESDFAAVGTPDQTN